MGGAISVAFAGEGTISTAQLARRTTNVAVDRGSLENVMRYTFCLAVTQMVRLT